MLRTRPHPKPTQQTRAESRNVQAKWQRNIHRQTGRATANIKHNLVLTQVLILDDSIHVRPCSDRIFRSRFDLTHLFDTKLAVTPESLHWRLWWAGFEKIEVEARRHDFRFRAWKPVLAEKQWKTRDHVLMPLQRPDMDPVGSVGCK